MFMLSNLPIQEHGILFSMIFICFLPVLFLLHLLLHILYFIAVAYIVTRISFSISSVGGYLGDKVLIFEHFLLFGHLDKLPY